MRGPGAPGLVTVRGAELVAQADVILHDDLVPPAILAHASTDAEIVYVGKRGHFPPEKSRKQSEIEEALVAHARTGKRVVRLKGGDPLLFGRGSEEAEALVAAGIPYEVVPGVTSPLAAAAFAYVAVYAGRVNVGFFNGASLPDPKRLLQGSGRFMRHVKRTTTDGRDDADVAALIHAAYNDIRRATERSEEGVG